MKVVRVVGGLGNQMFQYAFYLSLKKKHKNVKLDISAFKNYKLHKFQLEKIFGIDKSNYTSKLTGLIFKVLQKFKKYSIVKEDTLFHSEVLDIEGTKYYSGYWNSENYFKDIFDEVRQAFRFNFILNDENEFISKMIKNSNSVSIHVRRGDYLDTEVNQKIYGGICTLNYYQSAIEIIQRNVENPFFFVFSNDIEWCKINFKIQNVNFIDWNSEDENYIDMYLMSICKYNIIANSSFGWWAAWLNQNKGKIVITPSRFFNDCIESDMKTLIPHDWIKVKI